MAEVIGGEVRCAGHVPAGRHRELAQAAAESIGPDACAVLLGNHGVVAGGRDLAEAVVASQFVEKAAMILIQAEAIGGVMADRRRGVARRASSLPLQIRAAGGLGRHYLGGKDSPICRTARRVLRTNWTCPLSGSVAS